MNNKRSMTNGDILISGAGIAGVTLAFWLKKFGFNPTIVEVAPSLREGGYAIDFMGAGYDIAEKMEILPELEEAALPITNLVFVDKDNRAKGSMNYQKIKKLMRDRALTLLRSDLATVIAKRLDPSVEILFGDSIVWIEQSEQGATVTFRSGLVRRFDIVVGADGLHSAVREIVFGAESQFEKFYDYYTSSFSMPGYPSEGQEFSMYNVPGKQVAVYSKGKDWTAAFFVFASPNKLEYDRHDIKKQQEILKREFEDIGWKCPELLAMMESSPDFYFDSISQIVMKPWSHGRVTLVGDACCCPSLLSGKGSTLAMVGAYILSGELKLANGDYETAFARYESIFRPFIAIKQQAAQTFAKSFVPKSRLGIWLRNVAFKLMSVPGISGLLLKQFKDEELTLKNYEE